MSADSRSPHTDALATLGTIITENEKRDAIHLAVEPVVAGHYLLPGAHVQLIDGKAFSTQVMNSESVGIVDPFLTETVRKGERFWLIVYPRQITSLRHVWTHPKFPEKTDNVKIFHNEDDKRYVVPETNPRFPEAPTKFPEQAYLSVDGKPIDGPHITETNPRFPEAPMLGLSVGVDKSEGIKEETCDSATKKEPEEVVDGLRKAGLDPYWDDDDDDRDNCHNWCNG